MSSVTTAGNTRRYERGRDPSDGSQQQRHYGAARTFGGEVLGEVAYALQEVDARGTVRRCKKLDEARHDALLVRLGVEVLSNLEHGCQHLVAWGGMSEPSMGGASSAMKEKNNSVQGTARASRRFASPRLRARFASHAWRCTHLRRRTEMPVAAEAGSWTRRGPAGSCPISSGGGGVGGAWCWWSARALGCVWRDRGRGDAEQNACARRTCGSAW